MLKGHLRLHGMPAPCSQPSVSYGTNAVKTTARGYRVLDFADGGRIEVHFPTYYLRGGWGSNGGAQVEGLLEATECGQALFPNCLVTGAALERTALAQQGVTLERPAEVEETAFTPLCLCTASTALLSHLCTPGWHPTPCRPDLGPSHRPAVHFSTPRRADRHGRVH